MTSALLVLLQVEGPLARATNRSYSLWELQLEGKSGRSIQFSWQTLTGTSCLFTGPPQVVSSAERRITENAGDTVRIVCHVEADPPPIVQWKKWSEELQDEEIINT